MRRSACVIAVVVLGAALFAACDFGTTGTASAVTDVSARLRGSVANTVAETTSYWFEYGTTTQYGHTTAHAQVNVQNVSQPYAVTATAGGLHEATTYHYRLCTAGPDAKPTCARDALFTTTAGRDSVTGFGTVLDLSFGYVIGADVAATSGPDGAGPVSGTAASVPGSVYFKIADAGAVTCLRVAGNRATVGFVGDPVDLGQPDPQPIPRLIFIEDNGPTGDRIGLTGVSEPPTTCPAPTAANFPVFVVGGFDIPPVITAGNFTVHDHGGP